MIDFYNFVIACIAVAVLTALVLRGKAGSWITAVEIVAAFIIGMAFHSAMLHEQARQKWRFWWDHES